MFSTLPSRFLLLLAGALIIGTASIPAQVAQATAGQASASATVGNRQIRATAEGSVSIVPVEGRALVTLGKHTLTVEAAKVMLDRQELAKLPDQATLIEIDVREGKLTLRADGKELLTRRFP